MTYYDSEGRVVLEEPLWPAPGILVSLFDSQMGQITGWVPISIQWLADFGVIDKDTDVAHAVLWDGKKRLQLWPIEVPRHVIRGDYIELNFWDHP